MKFVDVSLVRKGHRVRKTPHYEKVRALSDHMSHAIKANLVHGIKTFRSRISDEKLFEAWHKKKWDSLERIIPFDKIPEDISIDKSLRSTVSRAAGFEIVNLPAPIQREIRWDTQNPQVADFFETRSADLVKYISHDTRDVIKQAARNTYDKAWTPRDVADSIKSSIGLLPQHARAVENYRRGLIEEKMPKARVSELASAYADRLLDWRAMTIGRTEARTAANEGQISVWREGLDQGLLPSTATQVWETDGDPCPICDPMDGEEVEIGGVWLLNNGDEVENPSDSHPNCYCGCSLNFGDKNG